MDPRPYADVVHMWLWWSVFVIGRRKGAGVEAAFRAAQTATVRLYR